MLNPQLAMKRVLPIAILCMLLPCACIEEEPIVEDIVHVGDSLPDFMVAMNDGSIVSGSELRTCASVVMFFHTGCPDCRQVLPHIQQLYDDYASREVAFVLISREEDAVSITTYWEEQGFTMSYSAQTDRRVYELFARRRVPRIYIGDCEGTVQYVFTDAPVPGYGSLKQSLESVIGE